MDAQAAIATKIVICIIASAAVGVGTFFSKDRDFGESFDLSFISHKGNNRGFSINLLLWAFLLAGIGIMIIQSTSSLRATLGQYLCFCCINLSIYFLLLLILRPVLVRIIYAPSMVCLWLVPILISLISTFVVPSGEGKYVINIGKDLGRIIYITWFSVSIPLILVFIIRHLICRKVVLNNSKDITDDKILALWTKAKKACGIDKRYVVQLKESHTERTPYTIGCLNKKLIVVLPERQYTEKEYSLIFEHELMHITRGDCGKKLFIAIFECIFWFNPFVWIAMMLCKEDIELSCDEELLRSADEEKKSCYAELIINHVARVRGINSCLSSRSRGIKYRIKRILGQEKKISGAVLSAGLTFVLVYFTGYVQFVLNINTMRNDFGPASSTIKLIVAIPLALAWIIFVSRAVGGNAGYMANWPVNRHPELLNDDDDKDGLEHL